MNMVLRTRLWGEKMADREKLIEILRKPIFPHELVDPIEAVADYLLDNGVTVRERGRWHLEAHEENANFRWNVTAECPYCHSEKKEIWAGFFPGFPKTLAEYYCLESAKTVKLSNFCPYCGADMRGEEDG